jgi:four helix bundle protein
LKGFDKFMYLTGRVQGAEGRGAKGAGSMIRNYKDLKVWQKSYQICLQMYEITLNFPKEETYGLRSQLRRSAVSVPSNIAEGHGRKSRAEYLQFLYISYGSVCELETQVLLAGDLNYIKDGHMGHLQKDIGDVERMLKGLIKSLK